MERKEIVKVLGEHFGVKAKYMGVPSFAYQIETAEGIITIDKEGKIKNSEGIEVELERLLHSPKEEASNEEIEVSEVTFSMDGHTGVTLRNLINMINSKQSLIKKALEIETDIVTAEFVEGINSVRLATIEDFKAAAEEIGIKKVPGVKFDFEKRMIAFDFTKATEKLEATVQFAKALNESAKKFKQSSPKPTITDNEKYTFRTWLLRLGFIGDRYKAARNLLLSNLGGNSAFRSKRNE